MRIIHIGSAIVGLVAGAMFLIFGLLSQTRINPDLEQRGRLRMWFFPYFARKSDFTANGWHLRKLHWLFFGIVTLAALTWVLTA